jgi:hypothetical protein
MNHCKNCTVRFDCVDWLSDDDKGMKKCLDDAMKDCEEVDDNGDTLLPRQKNIGRLE